MVLICDTTDHFATAVQFIIEIPPNITERKKCGRDLTCSKGHLCNNDISVIYLQSKSSATDIPGNSIESLVRCVNKNSRSCVENEEYGLDCRGLGLAAQWSKSYDMKFPLLPSVDTGVAPSSVRINRGRCQLHQANGYPTCSAESHSITNIRPNLCPVQYSERIFMFY